MNGKDIQSIVDVAKSNAVTLWRWLDSKKTGIAAFYWSVTMPLIPVVWPSGAPESATKVFTTIGIVLTAIGLGHKYIKNQEEK